MQVLTIVDFEDLWNMATDLIYRLWMDGPLIDDDGNYIGYDKQRAENYWRTCNTNPVFKYLNFRECEELKHLQLHEVMYMTAEEIREKYLYAFLPIARKIMRTDSLMAYGCVAGDDITDEYLDTLLSMAWLSDLKIWAVHWKGKHDEGIEDE